MNNIIDGKLVRDLKIEELKNKVNKLKDKLTLVVISVGDNEASRVYVSQKEKFALKIGYNFKNLHFDKIDESELIKEIEKLNKDSSITGIIVQLPLPEYLDKNKIINSVSPSKDVDGLTNNNFLKLIKKEECIIPCTPKGIISLLDYYKVDLKKRIVIVGRSELVGLPLFHLLLNRNATITLCHSKTNNLSDFTRMADILVSAIGKPRFITSDMVKEDSVVIDVGINRLDDGKLCGDVDFDNVKDKTSYITPVPGGVGQMTVAELGKNTYKAYLLQKKK